MKRNIAVEAAAILFVAAITAGLFGGSAAARTAGAAPTQTTHVVKHQIKRLPKLTCSVKGIVFGAKVGLAKGSGCHIGKKTAPSVGSWVAKSYDVTAAPASATMVAPAVQPCYYGSGAGHGKSFNAPSISKYMHGPTVGYPALYQVSFTLSARWGKQKVSVTKTQLLRTPDSLVLCGAPPKISSFSGPAGACVWTRFPSIDTDVQALSTLKAQVGCPSGNGTCTWSKGSPWREAAYLIMPYQFSCSEGGYSGHLGYQSGYAPSGNAESCEGPDLQGASMYPLSNQGPGNVYVYAYVDTFKGGSQIKVGQANEKPTYWWSSGWFVGFGQTPPC